MVARHNVLVVDPMEETREVLRSVFEPRGISVLASEEIRDGLALARLHRPKVVVIDIEHTPRNLNYLTEQFLSAIGTETSLVFIGTAKPSHHEQASDKLMPKPYHYAFLIRKIEGLLAESSPPVARAS